MLPAWKITYLVAKGLKWGSDRKFHTTEVLIQPQMATVMMQDKSSSFFFVAAN